MVRNHDFLLPVFWFILFIATKTSAQLQPNLLKSFRSQGFGMVSYYDAVTSLESQTELIDFIKEHNISFINQYVCAVTTAKEYANFIDNVHNRTGAKINMLFDDTLVEHSHNSTCDIACTPGSTTGPGWCCASVARKFSWMVDVLKLTTQPDALDGAAFDIEGLHAADYFDLWTTMRQHWNSTVAVVEGRQVLRWYFGSQLADLAVNAVNRGLIDQIYWENYQNTDLKYVARARRLLDPLNTIMNESNHTHVIKNGKPVCLLSEINCCATPCIYSDDCGKCHSYELDEREVISFCSVNDVPPKSFDHHYHHHRKMDVQYMLTTLEDSRQQLINQGYYYLLAPNVLYDYRAIFMKIYGKDTVGKHLCPKIAKQQL